MRVDQGAICFEISAAVAALFAAVALLTTAAAFELEVGLGLGLRTVAF